MKIKILLIILSSFIATTFSVVPNCSNIIPVRVSLPGMVTEICVLCDEPYVLYEEHNEFYRTYQECLECTFPNCKECELPYGYTSKNQIHCGACKHRYFFKR